MACALEKLEQLESDSPLIASAKQQLALAVSYAQQYHETWHSIYWKTAKSALKRQVREKLNHLAFDAYTTLLKSSDCINRYVEEVKDSFAPPAWWNEMIISLTLAHNSMVQEHKREISSRQLVLFWELPEVL